MLERVIARDLVYIHVYAHDTHTCMYRQTYRNIIQAVNTIQPLYLNKDEYKTTTNKARLIGWYQCIQIYYIVILIYFNYIYKYIILITV